MQLRFQVPIVAAVLAAFFALSITAAPAPEAQENDMNIRQSHAVRIKYIYIYILFPIYYIIYILCMFEQCLLTRYSCPVCVGC